MSGLLAPFFTVMFSCCACVVYLEKLVKQSPGAMNLLTFSEFLFITLEGLIFTSRFFTVPNKIPLRSYSIVVVIFFLVNVVNNQALSFHVPLPLHIIFRSGSLLANMLLGMLILNNRYSMQKYLSVLLITAGIILCTLVSSDQTHSSSSKTESILGLSLYTEWLIGIAMLTFALFFSALLGIYQEKLYASYGKHPREALFYVHAMPLPFFAVFYKDISHQLTLFNESQPVEIPFLGGQVPVLWYFLILSVLTQYVCIRAVYVLTTEYSSLSVTLVITLRKFVSLLISVLYFGNHFGVWHWVGTGMVFGGTLIFADVAGEWRRRRAKKTE